MKMCQHEVFGKNTVQVAWIHRGIRKTACVCTLLHDLHTCHLVHMHFNALLTGGIFLYLNTNFKLGTTPFLAR